MRVSGFLGVIALTAAVCAPAFAQSEPTGSERMVVGEQRTLRPGYAVGDIAIANPSVCDFRVVSGRRDILLTANGEGFTTLTVWDQSGKKRDQIDIEVITREFQRLLNDFTQLLQPYPGVTIRRLGSRIVLGGTVSSQRELDDIKTLADAAGDVLVMVTLAGAAPPSADPSGAAVPEPVTGPPLVVREPNASGTIVRDPEPPPPARRPVPGAAQPVPLPQGGTRPATPTVPGQPEALPTQPIQAQPSAQSVSYLVEVYQSPATAPPPEVLGPQGQRLQMAQLVTEAGREIRRFLPIASQPTAAAQAKGVSVALTPEISGDTIVTTLVIDTNLPVGAYDQSTPVWLRARLRFSRASGETRYITEQELAGIVEPMGGFAAEGGAARVDTGAAADAVAAAVAANAPGGSYIPAPSSLVKRGGEGGQTKPRPTVLVIAITPTLRTGSSGSDTR